MIFFVGLSYKNGKDGKQLKAFCNSTQSGKLINEIIEKSGNKNIYKTNLFPGVPLDNNGKIRYPNKTEKEKGLKKLISDIKKLRAKKVFLFGKDVSDFVMENIGNMGDIKFFSEKHPSYILVYNRKNLDGYVENILMKIK